MTASPERVEEEIPTHTEQSHFQSGEEALSHLDDVIEFVVSEAIDYAEKPPEERTLPKLTRKAPPPPRPRNSMVVGNFNQMRPDMAANGLNRMPMLGANAQFQQKLHNQLPTMVPFGASPQQQQQLLMQYNGQYQTQPAHSQQQQYAQAAHFQALNQQAQYQAANAAALAQMQQLQRQQLQA
ncbi:hypothetical protein CRM22_010642 [Opisthorchis felineus]|uniref:Uncharacterized protein n=1 Tax=Opisthorchis felineus TaxID=147828 RepID=A0A4S2KSB5_OPIFE|nr:hypothetical protein CRM22_010642 [Opisthorchis felineus]